MIVETHCHTAEHSSCSHVAAVDLVRRAWEVGLEAILLTDHHYQWSAEELADLRRRAEAPESLVILAGQEVETRDFGHVLVYGARATIAAQKTSLHQLRQENPDAALIWAHPYRDKRIPPLERLLDPRLDAVEIFNSNYSVLEAARALQDWHTYQFTATAGTDTHGLSYTGSYPTIFERSFDTTEALVAEVRAGRCRPYFREATVLGGTSAAEVLEVTIGPEDAENTQTIVVKSFDNVAAWSGGERSQIIAAQLGARGFDRGTCRVAKPLDKDARSLLLIEEKAPGEPLYDVLVRAAPANKPHYLNLAALWLSKLHNARLRLTPAEEYLRQEPGVLEFYLSSLVETRHRLLGRVREIRDRILAEETMLFRSRPGILVQSHGDYHPRNIFIGRDQPDGPEYVTAIDFSGSYLLPRAFDVGTFLAQHLSMFFHERDVQRYAPADLFLQAYLHRARDLEEDFFAQVDLFQARTCLSILYYLAHTHRGNSELFWRILVEAEHSLAAAAVRHR